MEKSGLKGFRIAPDWFSHSGTILHFPHNKFNWPQEKLEKLKAWYIDLILTIQEVEAVYLGVHNQQLFNDIIERIEKHPLFYTNQKPKMIIYPTEDIWVRDYGAFFLYTKDSLKKKSYILSNWLFNNWGNKYSNYFHPANCGKKWASIARIPYIEIPFVLEGGSIDSNGKGLALTTKPVLFNRNPNITQYQIDRILYEHLGIENLWWLPYGLYHDDTGGHIDQVARFIDSNTIIAAIAQKKSNPNYFRLKQNIMTLEAYIKSHTSHINLHIIPLPEDEKKIFYADNNSHLSSSYLNFYHLTDRIIVPIFNIDKDEQVVNTLEPLTNRTIIPIDVRIPSWQFGGIHCLTQPFFSNHKTE